MTNGTQDTAGKLAELEARRAARKAEREAQRLEQRLRDEEALDALQVEHGDGSIVVLELDDGGRLFVPGVPTMIVMRLPRPPEVKRLQDMLLRKGADEVVASNMLADLIVLYPEGDLYKLTRDAFAGSHTNAARIAMKACQGKAAEEGKG